MASISLKIYSAALKTRTNVNVIIPTLLPAQDGMNKREHEFSRFYETHGCYPVLYLLHGTYGDEGDWQRFSGYGRLCPSPQCSCGYAVR